jgi:hypothetical protein
MAFHLLNHLDRFFYEVGKGFGAEAYDTGIFLGERN